MYGGVLSVQVVYHTLRYNDVRRCPLYTGGSKPYVLCNYDHEPWHP